MSNAAMMELVRENELLRAENAEMKALLRVDPSVDFLERAKLELGIMPQCAQILWALWDCKPKSRDAIFHSVWGGKIDQPEIKVIDVQVCRLRAALAPHGASIKTIWGYGYQLPFADRVKIAAVIGVGIKP